MSERYRVLKAAGVVGSATLLSRILGFIRDAVIAWYFGAGFSSDAFIAAFRIPNLLRRLFAEGSLSSAFIPVFSEYVVKHGQIEAFKLARSALRFLSVFLVIITIIGVLLAPWIVRIVAPGFETDKLALTVILTRIMFPYIFFIGLIALCMGILNVLGHFAAPALAPVLLNLSIIGAIFFLSPKMATPVIGLALGVIIGGVLQLLVQLPFLIRSGIYFWQKTKLVHPGLWRVGVLLPPIILGGAVYQINILFGTLLGSLLSEGSVTYLYFADRLVQFPFGIFAIAATTAVLPSLSRQAAANDMTGLRETFSQAIKMVFFITIPAMVGLIILREPIVELLFQRGEFDATATRLTAQGLLYYCIGLWAFSAVRIVTAVFFALQDTRTPVQTAAASIFANVLLGVILMRPMGHSGLALATSLASILNLGFLVRALRRRLGPFAWRNVAHSVCKTSISSIVMGIGVWGTAFLIVPADNRTLFDLFWGVGGCIAAGLCIYGAACFVIKSPELSSLMAEIKKGICRKCQKNNVSF